MCETLRETSKTAESCGTAKSYPQVHGADFSIMNTHSNKLKTAPNAVREHSPEPNQLTYIGGEMAVLSVPTHPQNKPTQYRIGRAE